MIFYHTILFWHEDIVVPERVFKIISGLNSDKQTGANLLYVLKVSKAIVFISCHIQRYIVAPSN